MTRRIAAAAILAVTVGCARVREVFEPAQYITEKRPSIVYVTQRNRALVTIVNPRVSGDTVLGTLWGQDSPAAVPFSDVHSISAVRVDGARTALLTIGIIGAAGLSAYALFGNASGHNNWSCDYNSGSLGPAGAPTCGPSNN